MADVNNRADLVFEGGGVKGIGLAGAFRELDDRGWEVGRVAGTSAGAITAALVAVGYTGAELERVVLEEMRFARFADGPRNPVGRALQLVRDKGLNEGRYFLEWMRERLAAKGITRFGQLRTGEPPDSPRAYRLQVIASDLTLSRMLALPSDAKYLGIDPDELEIAEAVRMSMSIPLFFDPVVHTNPRTGVEHVIIDGGLLSNFPVWLFDCPPGRTPACPTFGMLLVAPGQAHPLGRGLEDDRAAARRMSLLALVKALAHTAMDAHDRLYVERANYARTIPIPTLGVGTTEFGIAPQRARALFDSGARAAAAFLETWDFDAYIAAFRSPAAPQPTRREAVLQTMDAAAGVEQPAQSAATSA